MLASQHAEEFAAIQQFSRLSLQRRHHFFRLAIRIDRGQSMDANCRGFPSDLLIVQFHVAGGAYYRCRTFACSTPIPYSLLERNRPDQYRSTLRIRQWGFESAKHEWKN